MAPKKIVVKTPSQSNAAANAKGAGHPYGTRSKSKGLGATKEHAAKSHPPSDTSPTRNMEESIKSLPSKDERYSSDDFVASSPRLSFAFSPHRSFASKTNSEVMTVNTTGSMSLEEQVALPAKTVESLTSCIKERDDHIAFLMKRLSTLSWKDPIAVEQSQQFLSEDEHSTALVAKRTQPRKNEVVTAGQMKHLIKEAIHDQVESVVWPFYNYVKPYSQRINRMRMPVSYQLPKFQQFEGKGNLRQHVAHFVETYNNADTFDDLLVKQFIRSLKGNAFDWYTDLEPGTIDSWDQLE